MAVLTSNLIANDLPEPEEVEQAMVKATNFFRQHLSAGGGYASSWTLDPLTGHSEHRSSPTVVSIQPPGTTTVGLSMTKAFRATEHPVFLKAAREAASSLDWCQLASGGWNSDFDLDPSFADDYHYRRDLEAGDTDTGKRRNLTTLDDNKTQSAITFLLELTHLPAARSSTEHEECLTFALESLIGAQSANGGWPQKFDSPSSGNPISIKASFPESWPREWPNDKYYRYDTLNDGNIKRAIDVLLQAWKLTGNDAFLKSAKRAGDFLLLAQFDEPQPGWAQQYNEAMQPAWARKFEPPSLSSAESFSAIQALFELWIATGDEKYMRSLPSSLDWLERGQLKDGRWSRFYEMVTNRPIYLTAETYQLTYDDSNLPTHYGFKVGSSFGRKIEKMRESIEKGRAEIIRSRTAPDSPEGWAKRAHSLAPAVERALKSQESKGYWIQNDRIDAGLFSEHIETMAAYCEAAKQAGDAFSEKE
tara:strand:+ start:6095 stop:7522 length:1428 start_codon:yes stop_codon:yes gene_type:complete